MPLKGPPKALEEALFRREAAHLVASLTRLLGPRNLPLVEDVVQDALLSALQAWRFELPDDPEAWLLATARNRAFDVIRHDRRLRDRIPLLEADAQAENELRSRLDAALDPRAAGEDLLAMMFACCHDGLSEETHVTLILRFLAGLGPREIAAAFLVDVQTIDRRLHRGRERLEREQELRRVSDTEGLLTQLPSVLRALYLLFNEGYHSTSSDMPIQASLCAEAMRLGDLLLSTRATALPEVFALQALFCFNAARLCTRIDGHGVFVPLADQDRTQWNRALIDRGVVSLGQSASGTEVTRWHLEAGIACAHTLAPSVLATDWERVVALYDSLMTLTPGPVVALNRALALAEHSGPEAGRSALRALEAEPRLERYPYFWAALADLERRCGRDREARQHWGRAVETARNPAERTAFERKRAQITEG